MALLKYRRGIILIYLRDFTAQIQTASSKSCPRGASRSPFFISGHGLPRGALGLQVMLGHEELHSPHLFLLDYSSGGFCLALGLCSAGLHPSRDRTRTGPGEAGSFLGAAVQGRVGFGQRARRSRPKHRAGCCPSPLTPAAVLVSGSHNQWTNDVRQGKNQNRRSEEVQWVRARGRVFSQIRYFSPLPFYRDFDARSQNPLSCKHELMATIQKLKNQYCPLPWENEKGLLLLPMSTEISATHFLAILTFSSCVC